MRQRTIGRGGPSIGSVGFGCMSLSGIYSDEALSAAEASAVIHAAVDAGSTFIDTAHAYGGGDNERLVGAAIADIRAQVVLSSKVGLVPAAHGGAHAMEFDGRPETLRRQVEESLRRLHVDHIDIAHLHRVDGKVAIEESWGALADLVTEGRIGRLGLSEVTVAQAERAHAIHPVAAIQSEFSLWARAVQSNGISEWARANGAALAAFSPLGQGFLTGAAAHGEAFHAGDARFGSPRFTGSARDAAEPLTRTLGEIATEIDASPSQVALAWLLAQGPHVVPIPGTRHIRHVRSNAAASAIVLSADAIARLDRAVAPVPPRH